MSIRFHKVIQGTWWLEGRSHPGGLESIVLWDKWSLYSLGISLLDGLPERVDKTVWRTRVRKVDGCAVLPDCGPAPARPGQAIRGVRPVRILEMIGGFAGMVFTGT